MAADAHCPWCDESLLESRVDGYAYIRSRVVLHLDTCRSRPANATAIQQEAIADAIAENASA